MPKKSAAADAREKRRAEVSELLLAGASQREIAEELGVSVGTINADVKALRKLYVKQQGDNIVEMVAVDLQRLDIALSSIWNGVLTGNLDSVNALLNIMAARASIIGYKGMLRELFDEKRGKQPAPGVTVNMFGGNGRSAMPLPDYDAKLIQAISELPADGLSLFIQNMLLASGDAPSPPPIIIENEPSRSNVIENENVANKPEHHEAERL